MERLVAVEIEIFGKPVKPLSGKKRRASLENQGRICERLGD
jgi:hypothetical protein